MVASPNPNPFVYLVKRASTILRTDGPASLVKRIRDRLFLNPLQSHCFVYGSKYCEEFPTPICEVELEFKEIAVVDNDEIDELTRVDEWHTSKSSTLKRLEEGEHIYVAKYKGRIVASVSVVTQDKFEDRFSKRILKMAHNEAYYWRGFVVPSLRDLGIWPAILRYYWTDIALKYGRNNVLIIILTTNKSSLKSVSKIGWVKVGRIGFIEIFGIRFHYLWGREAFKETKRRFLIQNIG